MTAPCTVGIDLGSSAVKAAVVDPGSGVLGVADAAVDQFHPHPGWSEADPDQWWASTCAAIGEALQASARTASDIRAVSVSGMVPAVVGLDEDGRPVRPAILQNDARAVDEIDHLRDELAAVDLLGRTGSALTQQSVAPTVRWLQRHEPEATSRVSRWQGSYDHIAGRLGAEPHVEFNWAIESGLVDLTTAEPIGEVLDAVRLERDTLPPVRRSGDRVGKVSSAAAEATGLTAGTPIVVGGADHVLSAYAAGLAEAGDLLVKLGGAGDILAVSDTAVLDPRLYLDAHPDPTRWLPNGCMATSGTLIRWFDHTHGAPGIDVLEKEAADAAPAEVLCLPYFLGEKSPLHDPDLRGAFLGLHLGHTRGDLYRAVLEGIGYGFRHHVDVLSELGLGLATARVSNGGSRSRIWKQIIADTMGVALVPVLDHPGASLGAALVAARGVGLMESWRLPTGYVRTDDPVVPDPGLIARYDDGYARYLEAGRALTPISHALARRDA